MSTAVRMLIGVGLIFRPLVVLADVIPLLGSLLSLGTFLIALALAIPLSRNLAWSFHHQT